MRSSKICFLLILAVTLATAAVRLPRLAQRPMHTDEAIHAYKFGTLLESGEYVYDPVEYHGPTLNYFTMIPAKLCGQKTYQQINEFTLRVVPVAFGVLLVLLAVGVADGMGRPAAIVAAVLTAVSHAMIFYSRYYIQETLLVCFTFGVIVCGWRYVRSRRPGWAGSAESAGSEGFRAAPGGGVAWAAAAVGVVTSSSERWLSRSASSRAGSSSGCVPVPAQAASASAASRAAIGWVVEDRRSVIDLALRDP